MSDFLPPYPHRFAEEPSTWQRIMAARRNLIGMWAEAAFDYDFVGTRILAQHVFVCNTPEPSSTSSIHATPRSSARASCMRRMLGPLARDGLIISDGEIWRKRRKLVSPIIHVVQLSARSRR